PVLRNYKITGTDGWHYTMSMVTTQNVKADITAPSTTVTNPKSVVPLRDFNGDAKPDLLLQNNAGQIAVWYLNGSGATSASAFLFSGGLGDWRVKGAVDLNSDGNADLVFQNNAGQIAVWYMNGSGGVASSSFLFSGGLGDWKIAGAADINGDGNTDLLFQ